MKKILSTLCIGGMMWIANAQNSFQFNQVLQPNSTYTMSMKTDNAMQMELITAEELPAELKKMEMLQSTAISTKTETQGKDATGAVPYVLTYTYMDVSTTMNGQKSTSLEWNEDNDLKKIKIHGKDTNGNRVITSVEGPEAIRKSLEVIFDGIQSYLNLPKDVFHLNEAKVISGEMKIPVENALIPITLKTTYTFRGIEDGKAKFDLMINSDFISNQISGFDFSVKQYEIKGELFIDTANHNIINAVYEGPVRMLMTKDDLKINLSSDMKIVIQSK